MCGQVQFEIHGELRDVVNCHCSKCRKFHGNYGAYTIVKVENLKITEQKSLQWYESCTDETADVRRRGFRFDCGSPDPTSFTTGSKHNTPDLGFHHCHGGCKAMCVRNFVGWQLAVHK